MSDSQACCAHALKQYEISKVELRLVSLMQAEFACICRVLMASMIMDPSFSAVLFYCKQILFALDVDRWHNVSHSDLSFSVCFLPFCFAHAVLIQQDVSAFHCRHCDCVERLQRLPSS